MSDDVRPRRWRRWGPALAAALLGATALAVFAPFFLELPVLYDTDSYYHLAIARAYAASGIIDSLPWARFSVMAEGFGDKEILFHLLLAPFADTEVIGSRGGRWALALLNAAIVGVLAWLGVRAVGPAGALAPAAVYLGSQAFVWRAIRLRPELLALLLFLVAAWLAGHHDHRRYRLLGVVAFLFTLAYTAFHALLGLCFLWLLPALWHRRPRSWGLLLYPLLGAGLALIVHPHFPHNLVVWKIQSVDFFGAKQTLDVGAEIAAPSARAVLVGNLGWWLALAALLVLFLLALRRQSVADPRSETSSATGGSARRERSFRGHPRRPTLSRWLGPRLRSGGERTRPQAGATESLDGFRRLAEVFAIAATAFLALYLAMGRFIVYLAPFGLLTALFALGAVAADRAPSRRPRQAAVVAALLLATIAGALPSVALVRGLLATGPIDREADWAAFGRAMPDGARVAAPWGDAAAYLFWAPQAAYLNVLDPVFMAVRYPRAYAAQAAIFAGREADVPRALYAELDSDHLAFAALHAAPALLARLDADPRMVSRHGGLARLYAVAPADGSTFVLDWRQVPRGTELPPPPAAAAAAWPRYPRAEDPAERALEGYVDLERLAPDAECVAVVHDLALAAAEKRRYELSLAGPGGLWLDHRLLAFPRAGHDAVLGRGLELDLELEAGEHRFTVLGCRAENGDSAPAKGFYLLRR